MSTATLEKTQAITVAPRPPAPSVSLFREAMPSAAPLVEAAPAMLDALLMSRSALQQCNLFSHAASEDARIQSLANYQDWFIGRGSPAMTLGGPRRSWSLLRAIRSDDRVIACAPFMHKAISEFSSIPQIHTPAASLDPALRQQALMDVLVWATGPRLLVCGMATGHPGWQQAAVQSLIINGRERSELRPGLAAWLDLANPRMKASARYLDYTRWYMGRNFHVPKVGHDG